MRHEHGVQGGDVERERLAVQIAELPAALEQAAVNGLRRPANRDFPTRSER